MMFSRIWRTNDWFVLVDCFGGRRYRVEYKYIIPCWIGVVFGMVGLICGEVWGFGVERVVTWFLVEMDRERGEKLKSTKYF